MSESDMKAWLEYIDNSAKQALNKISHEKQPLPAPLPAKIGQLRHSLGAIFASAIKHDSSESVRAEISYLPDLITSRHKCHTSRQSPSYVCVESTKWSRQHDGRMATSTSRSVSDDAS
jgi:hypothetical protein